MLCRLIMVTHYQWVAWCWASAMWYKSRLILLMLHKCPWAKHWNLSLFIYAMLLWVNARIKCALTLSLPFSPQWVIWVNVTVLFPSRLLSVTFQAWICNQLKLFAHSDLLTSFYYIWLLVLLPSVFTNGAIIITVTGLPSLIMAGEFKLAVVMRHLMMFTCFSRQCLMVSLDCLWVVAVSVSVTLKHLVIITVHIRCWPMGKIIFYSCVGKTNS